MTTTKPQEEGITWAIPPNLDIPNDVLVGKLEFFANSIRWTRMTDDTHQTMIVSPMDIAHALAREISFCSGLLPGPTESPNSLWWRNTAEGPVTAIWQPPKVWRLALQVSVTGPAERYTIPMPGLVFLCMPGRAPWVFALKKRPRSPQETVYHAPLFNLFENGNVCAGTHKFPDDVGEVPESFFRSFFTEHAHTHNRSVIYPKDLNKRWETLKGERTYPLKDLVEAGTVQDLMDLNMGQGRSY